MTAEELKEVLERHKHWLSEDCEGWENMKADLSSAHLRKADLRYADLSYADLRNANLRNADLRYADLSNANLRYANLRYADLRSAHLRKADLSYADLRSSKNDQFIPMACPDAGAFTAWKKARGYIVKLLIPEDARRSAATTWKCRCDKALVLEIQRTDGTRATETQVASDYDSTFLYRVGETVSVDDFDDDRFNECSTGIHFFINRQSAVEY